MASPLSRPPKILLVGAGRFGLEHLHEWSHLAALGEAELAGVVVTREASQAALRGRYGVPIHRGLVDHLVRSVDAVDIATPSGTHAELVRRCLPLAHVLVEKPLATEVREAAALSNLSTTLGRVLMVGHLFRFHPVIRELKRVVAAIPEPPRGIEGAMINPLENGAGRDDAHLELLHLFDIVDFLFGVEPDATVGRRLGPLSRISLRYPGPMTALLRLGWEGEAKVRTLQLVYPDRRIVADLVDNSLVVSTRNNQLHKRFFPEPPQALREELRTFIAAIGDHTTPHPDAAVGERIVRVAVAAAPAPPKTRPRVAVIGGGIFGASCALELSKIMDVTLFERHPELLSEVSTTNQRRHHAGFHYPRSHDTVVEIKAARRVFEAEYGDAINRDVPAYFCTSATGIEIPAERFLAACQSHDLSFCPAAPPEGVVDASRVSLCLKTDEAVYDHPRLRQLVTDRLHRNPRVRCRLRTRVVSGTIARDGSKRLGIRGPDGAREESFDYVVNATYANRNVVAGWFGFPTEPLRFDLCEILLLRLPIPQICVTVLDGPFTSLTGTGRDDLFLLSHIHDSVSRSVIAEDGTPPTWDEVPSNRANMLRHSARYLPILSKASDVRSWWATRAVSAFARDSDARPTVVTDHGFGCWSVLGGKIITCVANAREIAGAILAEHRRGGTTALAAGE